MIYSSSESIGTEFNNIRRSLILCRRAGVMVMSMNNEKTFIQDFIENLE